MKNTPPRSSRSPKTAPISVRLPHALNAEIDKMAARLDRSRSWVIAEAIDDYVERQKWEIAAIEEGIRQADAGLMIPHEQVVEWTRSLGTSRPLPRPRARKRR